MARVFSIVFNNIGIMYKLILLLQFCMHYFHLFTFGRTSRFHIKCILFRCFVQQWIM